MTAAAPPAVKTPIFTRPFLLVSLTSVGGFVSSAFLAPLLPRYAIELGATSADLGLIVSVYWIASVGLRPHMGRMIDRRGATVVLTGGAVISLVAAALYGVTPNVAALIGVRVLHGIGLGAMSAAAWALVADYAPPDRRGEAVGYFGMFLSGSFVTGPIISTAILGSFGNPGVFAATCAVTAASLALSFTLTPKPRAVAAASARPPAALLVRSALLPALAVLLMMSTFAPIGGFLPLLTDARSMGLEAVGLFLSCNSGGIFFARVIGGRISDRYGRAVTVYPGLLVTAAAIGAAGLAPSLPWLLAAAFVHGSGVGMAQASLIALAVDRSSETERGGTMAMMTSAMDLGLGLMALPLGWLLAASDIFTVYWASGGMALLAVPVFAVLHRQTVVQTK